MQNEKKYFLSQDSMLDGDSADFAVSTNAWVNSENVRTGSTDTGVIGTFESIGSTVQISSVGNTEDYICVGTASDEQNKRFVSFWVDMVGDDDKIECCYTDSNTFFTVLRGSQVDGGLNFDKNSLIHSAKIIDNILSWVEGTNNEPRKINIESGIVANDPAFQTDAEPYVFPLQFSEITLIKPPPGLAPNIDKTTDTTFIGNYIAQSSFQFAFQYVYYDLETTVTGPYSVGSRVNAPESSENVIDVDMDGNEFIPNTVKIVNLIARQTDGTQTGGDYSFVAKSWDKDNATELAQIEAQNDGSVTLNFRFYNNVTGLVLAADDTLRPFDNVPIYSQTHEIARSRYFLANNTEGYDTPEVSSLTVSLSNVSFAANGESSEQLYKIIIQSKGTADGIVPVKQWSYQAYAVLQTAGALDGYYAIKSTETYNTGTNALPPFAPLPSPTVPILWNTTTNFRYLGFTISQVVQSAQRFVNFNGTTSYIQNQDNIKGINNYVIIDNPPYDNYSVFAQASNYKFGVVFYDYAMRKCGVATPPSGDSFVKIKDTFVSIRANTPNLFELFDPNITSAINPGDQIIITGTGVGGFDGTYDVVNTVPFSSYVFVSQTIPSSIYPGSIFSNINLQIYRIPKTNITTGYIGGAQSQTFGLTSSFLWDLDDVALAGEIPDWARYYSVVRTLNLRTRFFVMGCTFKPAYAYKDVDGVWQYSTTVITPNTRALALDTPSLEKAGLGYVFEEGDMCILTSPSGQVYTLPVIGQDSGYVLVKFVNIGTDITNSSRFRYELYTPYRQSTQEPYYEIGEVYRILDPGTVNRAYSVTTGFLKGDSYLIGREFGTLSNTIDYNALAMCNDDTYYKRWDSDGSKINYITKLGRETKTTSISFSDAYNLGINGNSTFRLLNQKEVPDDCGSITKLVLTSKIQGEGTVMLSICTNETNSMYLQETQIVDSTGATQFFSASSPVISTINTLKGSFGTTNPESVVEFRGRVYYADANRGVWVQYSENGLFPISNYKMTRFWKLFFAQYLSMTTAEIEDLGSRPFLFATVDPSHLELLISIPKLLEDPPKGYLPDYPSEIYPFDIWDGQTKTMVFCLENLGLPARWQGAYTYCAENYVTVMNKLFSMKGKETYINNQTGVYNNFYNVQNTSKVMIIANQNPQRPKVYNNVTVEANMSPAFVYLYNDYPYLQSSDLEDTDFRDLEGVYYSPIYRNKIVPLAAGGFTTDGLFTYEKMRNVAMKMMFEFEVGIVPLELKFLNIGYQISRGHTT
jgi:hypothetical protein